MSTKVVSTERVIAAPADRIFAVLADPRQHTVIDGSGTVKRTRTGPDRLSLGAKFGMAMHHWVPYPVTNTVVEFEEGRRIAWRHMAHDVWRYELEPARRRHARPRVVRLVARSLRHVPRAHRCARSRTSRRWKRHSSASRPTSKPTVRRPERAFTGDSYTAGSGGLTEWPKVLAC